MNEDKLIKDIQNTIKQMIKSKHITLGPVILPEWLYDAAIKAGHITSDSKEYIRRQPIPCNSSNLMRKQHDT